MRLSQVQPDTDELRLVLEAGYVLREAGRLDDAEAVFRGAIALLPSSEIPVVALGTVELQRGRFIEAQAICEQALRLRPDSLYARVHHAEALLFQGRRAEAESELCAIIASDPESTHSRTARTLLDAAELICREGEEAESASLTARDEQRSGAR
jgi:tetratricopeptide (TPR) repeat protein